MSAVWPNVRVPRETLLTDRQRGFAGGLNSIGDAFSLSDSQMVNAENVRLTKYGAATKRGGTQSTALSPISTGKISGGYCWRKADGSIEHLVTIQNAIYSSTSTLPAAAAWTSITPGGFNTGLSFTSMVAFVDAGGNEVVYIATGDPNPTGSVWKYNGATVTQIAASPGNIKYLAVYNQRLFGITGDDQTVYYSALNDGDTLGVAPNGGSAVVRTFGDQKLTALLTLRDSLVMFHVSGMSRFVGLTQDDISIATGAQGFSSDVGTLFARSVTAADGVGYFLSHSGAYRITDAGYEALDTPKKPDPTPELLASLDSSQYLYVCSVRDDVHKEVWWQVPDIGVFAFNYRLGSWSGPWTGVYTTPGAATLWNASNGGQEIVLVGLDDSATATGTGPLIADIEDLYVDNAPYNATTGDSYTMVIYCHRMFSQIPESEKSLRWGYIFVDLQGSDQCTVTWSTRYGSNSYTIPADVGSGSWGGGIWGSFIWGASSASRYRIPMGGRGPFFDIIISDDSDVAPVLSLFELVVFDLGPRG